MRGTRTFIHYVIIFIILILIFLLLLTASNFIPKQAMLENFKVSVSQVAEYEKMSTRMPQTFDRYQLDYHTDATMLDNAYFVDSEQPVKSAVACPSYGGDMDSLSSVVSDPEIAPNKTYSRYWHGYLILLRPLLMFLTYSEIGVLNTYLFYILLAVCLLMLYRKTGAWFALVFLMTIISLNIIIIPVNIQYFSVFILSFIGIWAVTSFCDKRRHWITYLFMVMGMCTMYFDFYTCPLLTYGFPMIVYIVLLGKEKEASFKSMIGVVLTCFAAWAAGYVLTWIVKIALAYFIVGKIEFSYAVESFSSRMAREIPEATAQKLAEGIQSIAPGISLDQIPLACVSIGLVLMQLLNTVSLIAFSGAFLAGIILRITRKNVKGSGKTMLVLLIVSLMPILWFAVAVNPTIVHYYFQYRTIGMTVFGVLSAVYVSIDFERNAKV